MNKKPSIHKGLVIGIIFLFIGMSITSNICGHSDEIEKNILRINEPTPTDDTISDWMEDVYSVDQTGKTIIITNSTDIEVDDLDILQITFTQQGSQVTLTSQVEGKIENRGELINGSVFGNEVVEYYFQLITSEQTYLIDYCNQTGFLQFNNETINLTSSDFSVVNDTLSIWFSLMNPEEIYENLYAGTVYLKVNTFEPNHQEMVYLSDLVPNILRKIVCIGLIQNINSTRDYLLFNPIFMTTILLKPFHFYPHTKGPIVVSKTYLGFMGRGFIIGCFDVDLSIFWPAQSPYFLMTYQIRNPLHREWYLQ